MLTTAKYWIDVVNDYSVLLLLVASGVRFAAQAIITRMKGSPL